MNPEIQKLIDTEWRLEDQLSNTSIASLVEAALSEEGRFTIEVSVPTAQRPSFADMINALTAVERRVRLSVVLAFLEPVRIARFVDTDALLAEVGAIPLRVTGLTMSSVKVTIEGDADEVSRVLNRQERPREWRRKLIRTLAVVAGAATIMVSAGDVRDVPLNPPAVQQQVREEVNRVCGYLPDGTEITLKMGVLEIKVPCKGGT